MHADRVFLNPFSLLIRREETELFASPEENIEIEAERSLHRRHSSQATLSSNKAWWGFLALTLVGALALGLSRESSDSNKIKAAGETLASPTTANTEQAAFTPASGVSASNTQAPRVASQCSLNQKLQVTLTSSDSTSPRGTASINQGNSASEVPVSAPTTKASQHSPSSRGSPPVTQSSESGPSTTSGTSSLSSTAAASTLAASTVATPTTSTKTSVKSKEDKKQIQVSIQEFRTELKTFKDSESVFFSDEFTKQLMKKYPGESTSHSVNIIYCRGVSFPEEKTERIANQEFKCAQVVQDGEIYSRWSIGNCTIVCKEWKGYDFSIWISNHEENGANKSVDAKVATFLEKLTAATNFYARMQEKNEALQNALRSETQKIEEMFRKKKVDTKGDLNKKSYWVYPRFASSDEKLKFVEYEGFVVKPMTDSLLFFPIEE